MIEGILSSEAERFWPTVEPWLQQVIDQYDPGYSTDNLFDHIKQQKKQLWVGLSPQIAAALVTEITIYPQYKVLHVPYVAGHDMDKWLPGALRVLEAFGRHHECKYVTGCGRRGWVKALESDSWKEGFTIIRKELT
jgi:hypothetical protein